MTTLGKYDLPEQLGRSKFGTVHRVTHTTPGREVAKQPVPKGKKENPISSVIPTEPKNQSLSIKKTAPISREIEKPKIMRNGIGLYLAGVALLFLVLGASCDQLKTKSNTTVAPLEATGILTEEPPASEAPVSATTVPALTDTVEPAAGAVKTSEKDGMNMVYVPSGNFLMGSSAGAGGVDEYPEHTVYLSGYWIDQTEVTNAMFSEFVRETGYLTEADQNGTSNLFLSGSWVNISGADWQHPKGPDSSLTGVEDHPVVHVSWNDAAAYCQWAGRSLPTEAQWEKAARGTDGLTYPWGNEPPSSDLANYTQNVWDTTVVGSYNSGASPYGALDMAGNVWEWVSDNYGQDYYSSQDSWSDPQGPTSGDYCVLRGASWVNYGNGLRTSNRSWASPSHTSISVGFRCSLSSQKY